MNIINDTKSMKTNRNKHCIADYGFVKLDVNWKHLDYLQACLLA